MFSMLAQNLDSCAPSEKQRVYDFEGKVLFETPRVYLARKADNIDIEFQYRKPEGFMA